MIRYDIRRGVTKIKTKTTVVISSAVLTGVGLVMAVMTPLSASATTYILDGYVYYSNLNAAYPAQVTLLNISTNQLGGTTSQSPSGYYIFGGMVAGQQYGVRASQCLSHIQWASGYSNFYMPNGHKQVDIVMNNVGSC